MRKTDKVGSHETWNWLETRTLKKEIKGMLMAAQDQKILFSHFFFHFQVPKSVSFQYN